MRCLRGSEWGASRAAMKSIYILAQIRSVLDYGRIVYDSAAKTFDVIQARALRLCSSAFKATPVSACNEVSRYGKKEAGTGEHLTHLIIK